MIKYQQSELYPYYRICRYLGIFCIHFNSRKERFQLRRSLICYVVHALMQLYLLICMVLLVYFWTLCFKREMTATGNHYERFVLFAALVTQFIQNAWLIWLQYLQMHIVRQLEFYRKKYLMDIRMVLPKRLLCFIVIVNVLYFCNYLKTCLMDWLVNASTWFTFSTLGFPLRAVISSFIQGYYVCLIHVVRHLLRHNQEQLNILVDQLQQPKRSCGDILRLRSCLDLHDRLLVMCTDEMSLVYGFSIWLCLLFSSLDASSILYIRMVTFTQKPSWDHCIISLLWLSPTLMTAATALMSDTVHVQANKTAKILAKIPRTGSGLDRMVEKFLLKNLRQQPILTAYGFFALDKSTLFKLFTAIFTYMVILVQFKEMENSTKSLQKA
ncbi:gustatory and pheromone receptor 39a [Drosophila grimshawi]|uniref:gustatory and pheromone receptor 39a n=1 Tax=Drosophila grimshawi TaxID=7222 RepID=UPI0013EF0BBA|nr:gustatory and pheromone receptor 39a [Drosophila grimshawi]